MFVYEFTTIMETSCLRGIQLHPDLKEIFIHLFADDIALISDTVVGLQSQLCLLHSFCKDKKNHRSCRQTNFFYLGRVVELNVPKVGSTTANH